MSAFGFKLEVIITLMNSKKMQVKHDLALYISRTSGAVIMGWTLRCLDVVSVSLNKDAWQQHCIMQV